MSLEGTTGTALQENLSYFRGNPARFAHLRMSPTTSVSILQETCKLGFHFIGDFRHPGHSPCRSLLYSSRLPVVCSCDALVIAAISDVSVCSHAPLNSTLGQGQHCQPFCTSHKCSKSTANLLYLSTLARCHGDNRDNDAQHQSEVDTSA